MKSKAIPIGVVMCLGLAVYSKADTKSEIVCRVTYLSELMIDTDMSTSDFYKVYTEMGAEGFCEKDFIAIKE